MHRLFVSFFIVTTFKFLLTCRAIELGLVYSMNLSNVPIQGVTVFECLTAFIACKAENFHLLKIQFNSYL